VLRKIAVKDFPTIGEFLIYANKMIHRKPDVRGVTISTVHQAKGGEWKNVLVLGVTPKCFPHPNGNPEEERRIYFVAISRAIDYLRLSFNGTPSPYLQKYLTGNESFMKSLEADARNPEKIVKQRSLFA
jgi:superfamily I DNA/RNA helicase